MKDSFDPYSVWLGISPHDQPPDHYRLLGIARFEPDPDVIDSAARNRLARIKALGVKESPDTARQIIKEIASARACLLTPGRRAGYDRGLRRNVGESVAAVHATPGAIAGKPGDSPKGSVSAADGPPRADSSPTQPGMLLLKGRRWQAALLIAAAVLAGLLSFLLRRADDAVVSRPPEPPASSPHSPTPVDESPARPEEHARQGLPDTQPEETAQDPWESAVEVNASPSDSTPSLLDLDRALADLVDSPPEPDRSHSNQRSATTPEDPSDVASAPEPNGVVADVSGRSTKLPVPDDASQKSAERRIAETFKQEFNSAKTPDQVRALAGRLFTLGQETKDDPTTRFALFTVACRLSAGTGELGKTFDMIDAVGRDYDVNVFALKADTLNEVVGRPQLPDVPAMTPKALLDTATTLLTESVREDEYAAANGLLRAARSVARKSGNSAILRDLTVREREIKRLASRFAGVEEALELLANDPRDPDASLTVGRWRCFQKGSWDTGLAQLAKGSDPVLAKLASQDLANPADCQAQMKLAEYWLRFAEKERGSTRSAIEARAKHWCDRAMPGLDESMADDDYETAGRLLQLALSTARNADDPELVAEFTTRRRELERLEQRFALAKASLDKLSSDPNDARANQTVGEWYCFEKDDWAEGLPLLAEGTDPDLAQLAQRDTAAPNAPKEQLKLADDWWQLAVKEKSSRRSSIQSRAAYWYEQALPKLSGLDKVRVERRLASIAAASGVPALATRGGVVQKGNVALASNGTTVVGIVDDPGALIDGEVSTSSRRASAKWPSDWIISFPKAYALREIRFRLWDADDRSYRYAVMVSPDGHTFAPLVDRSNVPCRGWQVFQFAARPVKAVRLLGLHASVNVGFAVVEFEAYCIPSEATGEHEETKP